MKKRIIIGVLFISSILISSVSISASDNSAFIERANMNQHDDKENIDDNVINGKQLLNKVFFRRNQNIQQNLFTSTIKTRFNNLEKTSEIIFGLNNELDVDNNENTGDNGKDIRIQYLILPYISLDTDFTIGAIFSVSIELLAEEISDNSFSVTASIADNLITVGYETPAGSSNEIPDRIQLSSLVFFQPSLDRTGFTVTMDPTYSSGQAQKYINLIAEFDDTTVKRTYEFGFQPATETQITICSTLNPDKWEYSFSKEASFDTIFTAKMTKTVEDISKETILTIDPLPDEVSFSLALTPFTVDGGSIEYQSETMYDISVLVETNEIGRCKYAVIKNTPRQLSAEWIPSRENGYYHVNLDSDGTTVYLLNSIQTPTINISISDLSTIDLTAYWNLTNPGTFEVFKDPSLHVDLDIIFEEWEAEVDAEPTAEHIYYTWKSNVSGYLTLDTDGLPLSDIDLLIKGPENGISIFGETLAAENFHLDWTLWPLSEFFINKTGSIDFFSLSIDVYINDQWYHLWPLF